MKKKFFIIPVMAAIALLCALVGGCDFVNSIVDELSHTHAYTVTTVEATCTTGGYTQHTCECGSTYRDNETAALGHTVVVDEGKAATCTEKGLTEGKHCSVCGVTIVDQKEIAPAHKLAVTGGVPATYTAFGISEEAKCESCGAVVSKGTILTPYGENCIIAEKDYIATNAQNSGAKYTQSYALTLSGEYEGKPYFVLTELTVSGEKYASEYFTGTLEEGAGGVSTLKFSDESDDRYIKITDKKFVFCDENGTPLNNTVERKAAEAQKPLTGNSRYGYNAMSSEPDGVGMCGLYDRMYILCESALTSTVNWTKNDKSACTIADIVLEDFNLDWDRATSVWKVFCQENPAYYWLSTQVGGTRITSGGVVTATMLELYADGEYSLAASRRAIDRDIAKMELECAAICKLASDEAAKAKAIHDYIIMRIDYARDDKGDPQTAIWAHNMAGVATKKGGVCEAYAKTFLYLCLKNGVEAIIVTGVYTTTGEAHAWNMIKIKESWYGVDATWDDPGGLIAVHDNFGTGKSELEKDHRADSPEGKGIYYYVAVPEAADESLKV